MLKNYSEMSILWGRLEEINYLSVLPEEWGRRDDFPEIIIHLHAGYFNASEFMRLFLALVRSLSSYAKQRYRVLSVSRLCC